MEEGAGMWTAGEAAPGAVLSRPNVMDLLSRTSSTVMADPVPFLLGGLWPMIVGVAGGLVGVVLIYALVFGGVAFGMASGDEDLGVLLGVAGGLGGFALMMTGVVLATVPMTASLHRAVWRFLVHGEKLTIGAAFSTFGQDLGRVLLYNVLAGTAILAGLLMCYVPGLVLSALLVFAGPAIYVHRLGVGEAVSLSVRHAQSDPGWHVGFFAIGFVITLVLQYVPILGVMLLATVYPLFVLLAYREIFGDGDSPRI